VRWIPLLLVVGCAAPQQGDGPPFEPRVTCEEPAAGLRERTLVLDGAGGAARAYDVYVPEDLRGGEAGAPVVFYFHPLLTTKLYMQLVETMELADVHGFIAVYPDGIGRSWNAGACCGPANGAGGEAPVDDVAFVRAVLADVEQDVGCIDRSRVYAAGFSNGGFLAHRLACEAPDAFAAIAAVSAVNGVAACEPGRPVPVLQMNGTTDELVTYGGGFSFDGITDGAFISARASAEGWAARDGCAATPSTTFERGAARCETYGGCTGGTEVTLCTLEGAGHCWFGEPFCPLGTNSFDLDATEATWDFLRRYRR
jgi:polyhydroxybutyrate depolymerase